MAARPRIEELLRLMDRAFAGNEHSLLDNIGTVTAESWDALPPNARRSVREITHHVGMFKYMYTNHAFRAGDMDYDDPPASPPPERLANLSAATDWLREAHEYLTGCIRELESDAELDVPRKAHWGEMVPTHHIIVTMLEHDLYHAGEINRTRALLQDDDAWWVPE